MSTDYENLTDVEEFGEASGSEKNNDRKDKRKLGKKQASSGKKNDKKASTSELAPELEERVVAVNRCAKVVKGGRRFSFSALLVVGDKNGRVGFGLGKAKEVPEAIRKAKMLAQKKLLKFPLEGGTIPHEVQAEFDAARIMFRPAGEGTGVRAAGACRAILEVAGVRNILTKSLRATNPHNVVKATFKALKSLRSLEEIAAARGKEVKGFRIRK